MIRSCYSPHQLHGSLFLTFSICLKGFAIEPIQRVLSTTSPCCFFFGTDRGLFWCLSWMPPSCFLLKSRIIFKGETQHHVVAEWSKDFCENESKWLLPDIRRGSGNEGSSCKGSNKFVRVLRMGDTGTASWLYSIWILWFAFCCLHSLIVLHSATMLFLWLSLNWSKQNTPGQSWQTLQFRTWLFHPALVKATAPVPLCPWGASLHGIKVAFPALQ